MEDNFYYYKLRSNLDTLQLYSSALTTAGLAHVSVGRAFDSGMGGCRFDPLGQTITWGLNPLSPKSDQHQISPCNISALQDTVDTRITDMITQDQLRMRLIFYQLLPTTSVEND